MREIATIHSLLSHPPKIGKLLLTITLLLLTPTLPLGAQEKAPMVKGLVLDKEQEALPGAKVLNLRTKKGAMTSVEGRFSIAAQGGDVLEISFVGLKSSRVQITDPSKPLRIVLKDDTQLLGEVIVTGYQKINSRVFVGSAVKVKTEDIVLGGTQDISRMLEGRVPGLNISTISGTFGAAPKINIRGGGSINGIVQPLWVIDGAMYEDLVSLSPDQLTSGDAITLVGSAIAGINPSDIESVEVLKDASATSLYGARGMNGVIVVSTKSGKKGGGLSTNYSFEGTMRVRPSYAQYDLLNSQETMSILREMEQKGYFSLSDALYGRRGGVYTQLYQSMTRGGTHALPFTEEAKIDFLRKAERYNTDWFKEIYKPSVTQNHMLSLSYGGERSSSYASLGYYVDPGETLADKVERITTYLKSTYELSEKLKTSVSVQGNFRNQKAPGTFPRIQHPAVGAYKRDFDINPFGYALGTSRTLRPYNDEGEYEYYRNDWAPFNIIEEYDQNRMDIRMSDFQIQLQSEWKPRTDLTLSAILSARRAMTNISHKIGDRSNVLAAHRAAGNPIERRDNVYLLRNDLSASYVDGVVTIPQGGIINKSSRLLQNYLGRIAADYAYSKGAHTLKAFGFIEARMTDHTNDAFTGYGMSFERANTTTTIPLIFEKLLAQGGSYFSLQDTHDRGIALSSSLTYNYKSRYVLNLVANYEGSNISGIGTRVRWLPTWNIGGKWNLDEEEFFTPLKGSLDRLALRASYGLVAKMNPQAINSLAVFNSALTLRPNLSDREFEIQLKHLENRDLTWEKMYELNLGIDHSWMKGRITGTLDFFHRNSFDLIDLIRTSGIGGEYYKWANFGDMRTLGVDFGIHTKNIDGKNLKWKSSLTFSLFNQKITRLINTPSTFDLVAGAGRGNLEGYPRSGLYSFESRGLSQRGLPQFYFGSLPLSDPSYGNITGANFFDITHNKSYLIYHGPTDPIITGGLSNSLQYKGLELSCYITYQAGHSVRLAPTYDPDFVDINVFGGAYYDRWLQKGDEAHTHVPTIPGRDLYTLLGKEGIERAYNTYNYSDVNVADGSFIRMKSISLGYALPAHLTKYLGAKQAKISTQVVNPFLIYSDKKLRGRDPEFVHSGGVASPIQRVYSLSFNLSF